MNWGFRRRTWLLPMLCGLQLLASTALAADRVLDASQLAQGSQPLSQYFDVLEDPSLNLTLADVQTPEVAARFNTDTPAAAGLNFGYTRSAYWLRLSLHNTSSLPLERMLEIAYTRLSSVQFHQPDANGGHRSHLTGSVMPFAERPYSNRNFVFPVTLPARAEQVVYLRIQSIPSMLVPARLWEPQAFHAYERNDYLAQAWYFGMVTAMVLFNLLIFVVLRDVIYLLYVIFVTCSALTMAAQNGLLKEFFWPDATHWADISTTFGYSVSLAALLFFMRHMLNTWQVIPKFDRFLKVLVVFYLLLAIGFAVSLQTFIKLGAPLFAIASLAIMGVGLYCAYQGQRSAIFFMTAFSMLLVGAFMTVLRHMGLVPSNQVTLNGLQFGSALEMVLLAFALADRFNEMRRERAKVQRELYQAQKLLVENLKSSERELENRVHQRTAELELTLSDLRTTQTQLIQAEKMASLGQLVANVAHEINTPIGAVKTSGRNIEDAVEHALANIPKVFKVLDADHLLLFQRLINPHSQTTHLSSREERAIAREATQQLEAAGIPDARHKAAILIQLKAQSGLTDYLPLLRHPDCSLILETAGSVATIVNNTSNINIAVDRMAKIVSSLQAFSRTDNAGEMSVAFLHEGVESVLGNYHSQIRQGTELVRQFQAIPPLSCLPDELKQVWTQLIHNALQAMNYKGTLTIGIRKQDNEAVVSVRDTGCGIPEEIRGRIFDAFFTTKPAGEGSGLGLDIVRKIIDKHQGKIDIQSEVGVGTMFSVHLPYAKETP